MDDYAKGQDYGRRLAARIPVANPERLFEAASEIARQDTPFSRGVADACRAEYDRRTGGASSWSRGGLGGGPARPGRVSRASVPAW